MLFLLFLYFSVVSSIEPYALGPFCHEYINPRIGERLMSIMFQSS